MVDSVLAKIAVEVLWMRWTGNTTTVLGYKATK